MNQKPVQAPLDGKVTESHLDRLDAATIDGGSEKKVQLDGIDGDEAFVEDDAPPAVIIPLKYRITAIVLIILFGTGNTYAGFVLGPLKTRLVRELQITSESAPRNGPWLTADAQYSVISSASSLINTLLPIIGGSIIDRYGGSRIALGSAVLCVAGTVLSACVSLLCGEHLTPGVN